MVHTRRHYAFDRAHSSGSSSTTSELSECVLRMLIGILLLLDGGVQPDLMGKYHEHTGVDRTANSTGLESKCLSTEDILEQLRCRIHYPSVLLSRFGRLLQFGIEIRWNMERGHGEYHRRRRFTSTTATIDVSLSLVQRTYFKQFQIYIDRPSDAADNTADAYVPDSSTLEFVISTLVLSLAMVRIFVAVNLAPSALCSR